MKCSIAHSIKLLNPRLSLLSINSTIVPEMISVNNILVLSNCQLVEIVSSKSLLIIIIRRNGLEHRRSDLPRYSVINLTFKYRLKKLIVVVVTLKMMNRSLQMLRQNKKKLKDKWVLKKKNTL